MVDDGDTERRWSIGEVSRACGVTVRALHHYDEIGLLPAGERTTSGHRRYRDRDLRRLYRIRALRGLGLSLEEIAGVLAGSADDIAAIRDLLLAQLAGLSAKANRIEQLASQLRGVLARIDGGGTPSPDDLMVTLEMMSVFESYFTHEQRDRLAGRRAELGREGVDDARTEWAALMDETLRHVQAATAVDTPQIRALVGRWDELGARFHGGDEQIKRAARAMWDDNQAELGRRLPWPPEQVSAVVAYLDRARMADRPSD